VWTLYHGTDVPDIKELVASNAGHRGYFGSGVYTTPNFEEAAFYGRYVYEMKFHGRVFDGFDGISVLEGTTGRHGDVSNFVFSVGGARYGSLEYDPWAAQEDAKVWAKLKSTYGDILQWIAVDEASVWEAWNMATPDFRSYVDPQSLLVFSEALQHLFYLAKRRDSLSLDTPIDDADVPQPSPSRRDDFYAAIASLSNKKHPYYEIEHYDIGGVVEAAGYDAVLIPGLEQNQGHAELLVFDPTKLALVRVIDTAKT
jgi:hypothetical protein